MYARCITIGYRRLIERSGKQHESSFARPERFQQGLLKWELAGNDATSLGSCTSQIVQASFSWCQSCGRTGNERREKDECRSLGIKDKIGRYDIVLWGIVDRSTQILQHGPGHDRHVQLSARIRLNLDLYCTVPVQKRPAETGASDLPDAVCENTEHTRKSSPSATPYGTVIGANTVLYTVSLKASSVSFFAVRR